MPNVQQLVHQNQKKKKKILSSISQINPIIQLTITIHKKCIEEVCCRKQKDDSKAIRFNHDRSRCERLNKFNGPTNTGDNQESIHS